MIKLICGVIILICTIAVLISTIITNVILEKYYKERRELNKKLQELRERGGEQSDML